MDFESRRLRVQLPCGNVSLYPCVFGTCRGHSVITCIYRTPFGCQRYLTCYNFRSWLPCGFPSNPTFPPTCGTTFDPTWEQIELPELEVDDLPILREQLEGQLKEVIAAQATIAKQQKSNK